MPVDDTPQEELAPEETDVDGPAVDLFMLLMTQYDAWRNPQEGAVSPALRAFFEALPAGESGAVNFARCLMRGHESDAGLTSHVGPEVALALIEGLGLVGEHEMVEVQRGVAQAAALREARAQGGRRMSRPGEYNRMEAISTVELTHLARGGTSAFLLRIDEGAGEPCRIVVWPPSGLRLELQKGDRSGSAAVCATRTSLAAGRCSTSKPRTWNTLAAWCALAEHGGNDASDLST